MMKKKLFAIMALAALLMMPVSAQAGGHLGRWHRSHHHHSSDEALAIGILGGILGGVVLDRIILSPPSAPGRSDPYDAGYSEGFDRGYRRGQNERYRNGAARGYEDGYDAGRLGSGL